MKPYENLANAIILQAVKDYRLSDDEWELQEIEHFFRSSWFGVLSKVNPEFHGNKDYQSCPAMAFKITDWQEYCYKQVV